MNDTNHVSHYIRNTNIVSQLYKHTCHYFPNNVAQDVSFIYLCRGIL